MQDVSRSRRDSYRSARRGRNGKGARRRRPWRWFLLGVSLAGLAWGCYWVQTRAYFTVDEVKVNGNQTLTKDELTGQAGVLGKSIAFVNPNEVRDRLEELTLVKRAKVRRLLPRTVSIRIEERTPWAVWQNAGTLFVIDDEGMIIGTTTDPQDMVLIEQVDPAELAVGSRVDRKVVDLAARLVETLPVAIGTAPVRFEYLSYGGLVVVTDNGLRARFGDGQDFEYKLATWKAILTQAQEDKKTVQHVDLRFGYRPFSR
jgi:cell division septal protein FtsQ